LESVARTGRLVVVDFDHPACGLAATICASVTEQSWTRLLSPPTRCGPLPLPAMGMDGNPVITSLIMPNTEEVVQLARRVCDEAPAGRGVEFAKPES
jgi:pyruvate/2-oxoglutarate/acetoin dehydrogenase E1 component